MNAANAYEKYAAQFLQSRESSEIGAATVKQWASHLDTSAEVLEIACGAGYPITRELVDLGLEVWAIDSSPSLLAEFEFRFPKIETRCELVQDSSFFDRKFTAVVAVGVVFLLPEEDQMNFLRRIARVLKPAGKFLFTAPVEVGCWVDQNTGVKCSSAGYDRYSLELLSVGFHKIESLVDSGLNHYYSCELSEEPVAQT